MQHGALDDFFHVVKLKKLGAGMYGAARLDPASLLVKYSNDWTFVGVHAVLGGPCHSNWNLDELMMIIKNARDVHSTAFICRDHPHIHTTGKTTIGTARISNKGTL